MVRRWRATPPIDRLRLTPVYTFALLTFLLVTVYFEMLWSAFVDASATYHAFSMPIVGTNFLGMLGASHAAYLIAKASPKQ